MNIVYFFNTKSQVVLSVFLGVIGLLIIINNWHTFLIVFFKKNKKKVSWIPLFGAVFLCLAFVVFPANPYIRFWWLAFIIDFGFLAAIFYSVFCYIRYNRKEKKLLKIDGGPDYNGYYSDLLSDEERELFQNKYITLETFTSISGELYDVIKGFNSLGIIYSAKCNKYGKVCISMNKIQLEEREELCVMKCIIILEDSCKVLFGKYDKPHINESIMY